MTKGIAGLWTWDKIIALCKTHKISAPEAATIINAHISDLFKGNSLINFIIAALVKDKAPKKTDSKYEAIKFVITKYKKLYKPKDKIIWAKAAAPLVTKTTRAKANYKNHIEAVRNRCKAAWAHDYWPKFYKEVWPKLKKDKQIKKDFL